MTKARLIKRQEIKEVEEQKEAGLKEEKEEKKEKKEGLGDKLGLMLGAKVNKRQDPRKAFADLFTPVQQ
ncbi:MAG: hypothetical protein J2P41_01115 [Blastocatellia bacterium]|nr:hypothetical protein [Blastocatellia bacterium]